jgi:hypothetical protein
MRTIAMVEVRSLARSMPPGKDENRDAVYRGASQTAEANAPPTRRITAAEMKRIMKGHRRETRGISQVAPIRRLPF